MSTTMSPPGVSLTTTDSAVAQPDQRNALRAIIATVRGSPPGDFLLEGRSGSGKTRLLVETVRICKGRIAVCAPTHKAASVLLDMLNAEPADQRAPAAGFTRGKDDEPGARVEVGTIHSFDPVCNPREDA